LAGRVVIKINVIRVTERCFERPAAAKDLVNLTDGFGQTLPAPTPARVGPTAAVPEPCIGLTGVLLSGMFSLTRRAPRRRASATTFV